MKNLKIGEQIIHVHGGVEYTVLDNDVENEVVKAGNQYVWTILGYEEIVRKEDWE